MTKMVVSSSSRGSPLFVIIIVVPVFGRQELYEDLLLNIYIYKFRGGEILYPSTSNVKNEKTSLHQEFDWSSFILYIHSEPFSSDLY